MAELLKEYTGTWEEILTHSDELAGQQVYLRVEERTPDYEEQGLSLEEAAQIMELPPYFVQELIAAGKLAASHSGDNYRITPADIEAYEANYQREASAGLAEMAAIGQEWKL